MLSNSIGFQPQFNPSSGKTPHFIILLCLTPDNFSLWGESAATQWVNQTICPCTLLINPLSGNAPHFIILLCLTPDNFTLQWKSAATQWVNIY
jgi:hypothetical protein